MHSKFTSAALKLNLFSLLILFFIFTNQSHAQKSELEKKLSDVIDSFYVTDKVPGIVVGIWTPELEYKKSIGKADLKTGTERTFEDKIRIGSITKTFVATVILQLADENKLSIDDPLSKYYPQYPNSDSITLRQMLDMTSGIPDYLADPLLLQSFFYDRMNKFTPTEILDATIGLGPLFSPGRGWTYSNGNYNLLGMIIEKVTGNKIENEIDKRIIQPLGLKNTSYPTSPYMEGQYSHGYFADSLTGELMDFTVIDPSITWAAGCMVSDIPDLKIYARALGDGTLISKKMQEERLKLVQTGVVNYAKYGLGIFAVGPFIGHNGGITGYNTTMCYDPELNAIIVVSVNEFGLKGGISDKVFMKIAETLYPEKRFFE